MATYLFTWVPEYYEELYGDYNKWLIDGSVDVPNWSSGSSKSIPSGARFFLMAQRTERRGIIARGVTITSTKTPGTPPNAHDNNVRLEEFSDPGNPLIPIEELLKISDQEKAPWNARGGGIKLSDDIAEKLEAAWRNSFPHKKE